MAAPFYIFPTVLVCIGVQLVVSLPGPLEHAADTLLSKHTQTHTPTPCSGVPGPKLNPCKILLLLLLRVFITAALRHVREGIEEERQGANMTRQRQEEWRKEQKAKMSLCTQEETDRDMKKDKSGMVTSHRRTGKKGALREGCWRIACLLVAYFLCCFLKYSLRPLCLQLLHTVSFYSFYTDSWDKCRSQSHNLSQSRVSSHVSLVMWDV